MSRAGAGVALVLALLLAGCNQLLGLDGAEVDPGSDSDGDGVPFDLDNCPLVANPDQADGDGDTIGDACDACQACGVDASADPDGADCGRNDEDGDGVGDRCDPCPVRAAAIDPGADLDTDGDGVGDGCDPSPAQAHRLTLDPFLSADGWILGRNSAIDAGGATLDGDDLVQQAGRDLFATWAVELGVVDLELGATLTFGLRSQFPGAPPRAGCTLSRTATQATLTAVSELSSVPTPQVVVGALVAPVAIRLSLKATDTAVRCVLVDRSGPRGGSSAETNLGGVDVGTVELSAIGRASLSYLVEVNAR